MTFSRFGHGDEMRDWARRLQEMMDEMRRRHFVPFRDEDIWQPATDVYECAGAYFICVELAGLTPEDVEVTCEDQHKLVVRGFRPNPRPPEAHDPLTLHAMEINHGPFRREIELPEPVDVDAIDASFDKGYLWMTLPKCRPE